MCVTLDPVELLDVAPGSHICWIVTDPDTYVRCAESLLRQAELTGEKAVVFGPTGSAALELLSPAAALCADPHLAFLNRGPIDPDSMFAMFEEQTTRAREEGYRGLRVVADMDWVLPAEPSTDALVAFELLLDRHAQRLGATIICAYRTASFDIDTVIGALCVHPTRAGHDSPPQFTLVAEGSDSWKLGGEVDIAVGTTFRTAIAAAVGEGPCDIDASGLDFIDVIGLGALADAGRSTNVKVRLIDATPIVRRCWELGRFADLSPTIELVG